MSDKINIRESIVQNLQKAIDKHDYMALVAIQLRIKTGFYENAEVKGPEKAKDDIKFLKNQYKKSYPHIGGQIDEVISYLESVVVMDAIEGK